MKNDTGFHCGFMIEGLVKGYTGRVNEANFDEYFPGTAEIDLQAIIANMSRMQELAHGAEVMAVVKANGYGHGRTEVALALAKAGTKWFGVSQVSEGLKLRRSFDQQEISRDQVKILSWLMEPTADWAQALESDLQLSASNLLTLTQIAKAAKQLGTPANIHLKIDVGMSRGGSTLNNFPELAKAAKRLSDQGVIKVVGLWSHLSESYDPDGPGKAVTDRQISRFLRAETILNSAGIDPEIRHLAATAGTIWYPQSHFDMVRVGIGLYGLSPNCIVADSVQLGIKPALTVKAPLIMVNQLASGESVSYGRTWRTNEPHWVGLVPLGYADGIPRAASNCGPVEVREMKAGGAIGRSVRTHIVGRVCMDQFMIDLGTGPEPDAKVGDIAYLFGGEGLPSVDEWAEKTDTINYEIVTRIAPSLKHQYSGG